jgi:hypothetical protein
MDELTDELTNEEKKAILDNYKAAIQSNLNLITISSLGLCNIFDSLPNHVRLDDIKKMCHDNIIKTINKHFKIEEEKIND